MGEQYVEAPKETYMWPSGWEPIYGALCGGPVGKLYGAPVGTCKAPFGTYM